MTDDIVVITMTVDEYRAAVQQFMDATGGPTRSLHQIMRNGYCRSCGGIDNDHLLPGTICHETQSALTILRSVRDAFQMSARTRNSDLDGIPIEIRNTDEWSGI